MFKAIRELVEIGSQFASSRSLITQKDGFITPALLAIQNCDGSNVTECCAKVDTAAAEVLSQLPIQHPLIDQLEITRKHITHCLKLLEPLAQDMDTYGLWIKQDAINALNDFQSWSAHDELASIETLWSDSHIEQTATA